MQKILISLSVILLLSFCDGNKKNSSFQLKGTLSDSKAETLYLEKLGSAKQVIIDSVILDENGNFEFTNYTPKIGFYRIKTNDKNFAMLVLDSADKVTITGSVKDLGNTFKVEGSSETTIFIEYNNLSKSRDIKLDSLNKEFQLLMETNKMDSKRMDSLSAIFEGPYNSIINQSNILMVDKISKNTNMYSSIMAIQALDPDKYSDLYKSLDAGLSKKFPNDKNVIMFHEVVERMLSTNIGQFAPEISLPSPDGKEIALSSLKGKLVLIDFWASWCGPCRKEMPNVIKIYSKFKNKGFEIYGVSLDQDKEKWMEAITKDGINWPQVSDLKYWDNVAARIYNVQGIPYTVLIDKDGKIIAKNLRGQELEKKIAEVLK
jgi:thiol-disulfide isomerase/thioredoxin